MKWVLTQISEVFSVEPNPWRIAYLNTDPKNTVFFHLKYSHSLIPFSLYFDILKR